MLRISPTTGLSLFKECPKCFWLHYNKKIHRPRGIFPSLSGGMDLVIKDYFDQYRGGLPPEIQGKVVGALMPDLALMNKWRNWRTGLEYVDQKLGAALFGALDECLQEGNYYIPLDYKTRGSAPKEGDSERHYQTQLDTYTLLLSANGYQTRDFAYLLYYFPKQVKENGVVVFDTKVVKLKSSAGRARKVFEQAVNVLRGEEPASHTNCEYCFWLSSRNNEEPA
jgi:hypothetical protein